MPLRQAWYSDVGVRAIKGFPWGTEDAPCTSSGTGNVE